MSDHSIIFIVALALGCVGLGIALAAALLLNAGRAALAAHRAETAAQIAASELRMTERALGMVADITQTRAAADTSVNRYQEAVDAEARLWAMRRRIEMEQAQAAVALGKGETK